MGKEKVLAILHLTISSLMLYVICDVSELNISAGNGFRRQRQEDSSHEDKEATRFSLINGLVDELPKDSSRTYESERQSNDIDNIYAEDGGYIYEKPAIPFEPSRPLLEPETPFEPQDSFTPTYQPEVPLQPSATPQPEIQIQPELPLQPEYPPQPEYPLQPEFPLQPEVPQQPQVPLQPEFPLQPEVPLQPEFPLEPEVPKQPIVPLQPEVPKQPIVPLQPEVPLKPIVPLQPEVPLQPKPEIPSPTEDFGGYQYPKPQNPMTYPPPQSPTTETTFPEASARSISVE